MFDQSIIFLSEGWVEFCKKKCSLIRVTLSKCHKTQGLKKVETVL